MLSYLRSVGIDDGFFPPHYKELKLKTFLVGTLCHGRLPKDIKVTTVTVDGDDGTERAIEVLRHFGEVDAVFLDGVTVAGFNFIDPEALLGKSKAVVVVYKFEPSIERIESALRAHFPDWRRRFDVILKAYKRSMVVETKWRTMRVSTFGDAGTDVRALISYLQTVSPTPEPLRVSDIVASSLSRSQALLERLRSKGSGLKL